MTCSMTQRHILDVLFVEKQASRKNLSARFALSKAALTLASRPLLDEGMVQECGRSEDGRVGRKEEYLTLSPDYGILIGLDIRAHNFYFVAMDYSGNVVEEAVAKSEEEACAYLIEKEQNPKVLALGITVRGNASEDAFKARYPHLASLHHSIPVTVINNVDALAKIYALYHPEDESFLLIKYGPGLGSSLVVNGALLSGGELGHILYRGETLEERISFANLLGEDLDEKAGAERLLKDATNKRRIYHDLVPTIYNASIILSLDKIVLAGVFLSQEATVNALKAQLGVLSASYDVNKVVRYEDYESLNARKGAILAFLSL